MKILLTNDDGVYAPGLAALYRELQQLGEVVVVAPESEQSAVGHAITLMTPLRVKEVSLNCGVEGFAVSGFPADCVKIAMAELLPSPPDLVVSGINLGPNVGINVLYSGTVSAATEAGILGVKGVAFSLDSYDKNADFETPPAWPGNCWSRSGAGVPGTMGSVSTSTCRTCPGPKSRGSGLPARIPGPWWSISSAGWTPDGMSITGWRKSTPARRSTRIRTMGPWPRAMSPLPPSTTTSPITAA